jgi:peptide/nickel transport system permease protein
MTEWRKVRALLCQRKLVPLAGGIILLFVVLAILAPYIAPYHPYAQNLRRAFERPSSEHWLGLDWIGRDVLSRLIYGTRPSFQIAILAVGIATVSGTGLGLLAGYFGGWLDTIAMRLIDTLMAIPPLIFALALATMLGGGIKSITIAIGVSMMPECCRLMRGMVLSTKGSEYVTAARAIGVGHTRIMLLYLLPNCIAPLIVLVTLNIGMAILAEASLSYLGIGITPPTAAWGAMIKHSYKYLFTHPLYSVAPGLCIMILVMAFNIMGDGLRDALDPRFRDVT